MTDDRLKQIKADPMLGDCNCGADRCEDCAIDWLISELGKVRYNADLAYSTLNDIGMLLDSMGCTHGDESHGKSTPPMMYPEWIGCVVAKRERELEQSRAEVADWRETQRKVMTESCDPDFKHCTCVPVLRAEMKRLKEPKCKWSECPNADGSLGWECNGCAVRLENE